MDSVTIVNYLRPVVVGVTSLNDLCLFSSHWIIAPYHATPDIVFSPLLTTVVYAVTEPLLARLVLAIMKTPFPVLIGASPVHMQVGLASMVLLDLLRRDATRNARAAGADQMSVEKKARDSGGAKDEHDPSRWHFAIVLVMHTISTALRNATLFLLEPSLPTLLSDPDTALVHVRCWLVVFGIVLYALSIGADYLNTHGTDRVCFISQLKSHATLKSSACYAALLIVIRSIVRYILSFPIYLGPGGGQIDSSLFAPERSAWLDSHRDQMAGKWQCALWIFSAVCLLVAMWCFRREQNRAYGR